MRPSRLIHTLTTACGVLAFGVLPVPGTARAETSTVKIPKSLVVTAVNAALSGFEINLDNWGTFRPQSKGTWHVDNSYVLFPSGKKYQIEVPRTPDESVGGRRYNAYVDDMKTQTLDVKLDGNRVRLRSFFESAGNEINIGCINKASDKPCKVHPLKHSGDLDNAYFAALFDLKFNGPRISLVPSDVEIDFDLHLDSKVLDTLKNIASQFVDIKGIVRRNARKAFVTELTKPDLEQELSKDLNSAFRKEVRQLLAGRTGGMTAQMFINRNVSIKSITSQGSNFVISIEHPKLRNAVGPTPSGLGGLQTSPKPDASGGIQRR